MKKILIAVLLSVCFWGGPAEAVILINSDFETGDYTGWNFFTTPDGATFTWPDTEPPVVQFDADNDSIDSFAARFQVGSPLPISGDEGYQGGGIYQNVYLEKGILSVDADIAAFWDYGGAYSNISPGRFAVEVNGTEIASHEFDIIYTYEKLFGHLSGEANIDTPGIYEIRFSVTAEGGVHKDSPYRYLDDIQARLETQSSNVVPEPSTVLLFASGLLGAVARRKRELKNK